MINEKCPHCTGGIGLQQPLYQDDRFWIVCDIHPLTEGHILIIPKEHISCIGVLNDKDFNNYKKLHSKVLDFINKEYGDAGIFEHGIVGQTVFHTHAHFLPFWRTEKEIVPERNSMRAISKLDSIKDEFKKQGKYLFIGLNKKKWLVKTNIGYPRIFRDRFANLLNATERSNWKMARNNQKLMKNFAKDIQHLEKKWNKYFKIN